METIQPTDRAIHVPKTRNNTIRTLGGLASGALQQRAELRRPLGGARAEAVSIGGGRLKCLIGGVHFASISMGKNSGTSQRSAGQASQAGAHIRTCPSTRACPTGSAAARGAARRPPSGTVAALYMYLGGGGVSACLVLTAIPLLLTRRPLRPAPPLLLTARSTAATVIVVVVHHNHLVVVVDVVIAPLGGRGGCRRKEVADLALLPDRRVVELLRVYGFGLFGGCVSSRCLVCVVMMRLGAVHTYISYPDGQDGVGVAAHQALDGEGAGGAHREACGALHCIASPEAGQSSCVRFDA